VVEMKGEEGSTSPVGEVSTITVVWQVLLHTCQKRRT
jgi:hypothetical protein